MGTLISLTGPSGAGKTTIAKEIIAKVSNAKMVQSTTTRDRRPSDLPGEYHYITKEAFDQLSNSGSFLWTAEHAGSKYGTLSQSILDIIESDNAVGFMILVPEVIPLLQKFLSGSKASFVYIPIFLVPPSTDTLKERLTNRGDKAEDIERRLREDKRWEEVARHSDIPFHFIRNDGQLENTVKEVSGLIG